MNAPHPDHWALSDDDRRQLAELVGEFEQTWHDNRLADGLRRLPPFGTPLRLPALGELVRIDLEKQWQRGRQVSARYYLSLFPELVEAEALLAHLSRLETEWRARAGAPTRQTPLPAEVRAAAETRAVATTPPDMLLGLPQSVPERFGRYRIVRLLGEGGMGRVYLAEDSQLRRRVALKIPRIDADYGREALDRFYREARAAAVLVHPNICPVFDCADVGGIPYLAMAYIDGGTLADVLRARGRLEQAEATDLVRRLALAMAEAHQLGIIHRDLKPSNVLLNSRGEPVITDFGLARRFDQGDASRITRPGLPMGTPSYMSPEQVGGEADRMGPWSDVYSLGVILYELLTGQVPFRGPPMKVLGLIMVQEPDPPSALCPDLDPRLQGVCLTAMAKDVDRRYVGMAEFAAALEGWLRSAPAAAPRPVPQPRRSPEPIVAVPPAPARSPWRLSSVLVVVLLAGLAGGAMYLYKGLAIQKEEARTHLFTKVVQDFERHEYDTALAGLEEVVKLDPLFGPAHVYRGHVHFARGDVARALADYDEARRLGTQDARAFTNRGRFHFDRREHAAALENYREAAKLEPGSAEVHAHLGAAYLALGMRQEAIVFCGKAVQLDEQLAAAYRTRVEAYNPGPGRAEACDRALEDCDRLIDKLGVREAPVFVLRGNAHTGKRHYDRAKADYEEARKLDGRSAEAYFGLGRMYHEQHKFAEAVAAFGQAVENDAKMARAYYWRGLALAAQDRHEAALADYKEALDLNEGEPWYHFSRGLSYAAVGKHAEAVKDFGRVIDDRRADKDRTLLIAAHKRRADAQQKLGNLDAEQADRRKVIELEQMK